MYLEAYLHVLIKNATVQFFDQFKLFIPYETYFSDIFIPGIFVDMHLVHGSEGPKSRKLTYFVISWPLCHELKVNRIQGNAQN